ncbi:MAG: NUDIX domain-containing protein [Patescibacteria group bacterium]
MAREEKQHKLEVHVAGIVFRETENNIEVLIVKRNAGRKLYPGKWECGGGQVKEGENFEEAIKRQMKEELGVNVKRALTFGTYEIKTPDLPQQKIPGIKFVCFLDKDKPYLKGNGPEISEKEHEGWRWQSINDLEKIEFVSGIREEIRIAWEFYSNNKGALES